MIDSKELLKDVEDYVFRFYRENVSDDLVFHSYNHIVETVKAAQFIGEGNNLNDEQLTTVLLAAWFHDSGYAESKNGHEELSGKFAEDYLRKKGYPQEQIDQVKGIIMATKMPQSPKNLLEEVMCDADLIHVGKKSFTRRSDLLRTELEMTQNEVYTDVEWVENEIKFLVSHKYHTPFAHLEFNNRKGANVSLQHALLKEKREEQRLIREGKEVQLNKKKRKELMPDRGIETMFRVTYRVHVELSGMADNKANILITINALIVSIIFTNMVSKFDENSYLIVPTFFLIFVCLGSIIFSTLSTRPKITGGTFTEEDVQMKRVNLLFFGNFFKMGLKEFDDGMNAMMRDRSFLYSSMIKDIYFLGKVLATKYKLIRTAYTIFMYGLILSALGYGIAFYLWDLNSF